LTRARSSSELPVASYAIASDFCRIFADEMRGLYLLSFLLTADAAKAEQCFASALEDCVGTPRVFKEWAPSWARRTVVQNAIKLINPARDHKQVTAGPTTGADDFSDRGMPLAALFALKTWERFVFVISVVERFSDQDCAALLGRSRQEIARTRNQAFKRIAAFGKAIGEHVGFDGSRLFGHGRLIAETA
jgi:DNA-directed RNA polymerase specialized sigma24 family protein